MEQEAQTSRQLWYIRREGQIEGPFTMGLVSRYVLLGRIGERDELSCDLITWQPLSAWPDLRPDVMKADSSDPQVEERLQAATRWADERNVATRRQEQVPVASERRHVTTERRQPEPVEEVQHRSARHEAAAPPAVSYTRVYGALIAFGCLLAMVAVLVMVPSKRAEKGSDCSSLPAPGVNWSNCFKEGVVVSGDLSGAILKNMKLSGADLSGSRLKGADLSYTELSVARLRATDLQGATMIGASLRGSDLRDANLRQANLSYADLKGADLRGADLRGAILDSAIWIDGRYCAPGSVGKCLFSAPPVRDRL